MNDHDPADATLLLRFLARVSGTSYDDNATQDVRRRVSAFFDTHLRDSPGADQRPGHPLGGPRTAASGALRSCLTSMSSAGLPSLPRQVRTGAPAINHWLSSVCRWSRWAPAYRS
ncbi:hypothetical protein LVO85_10495 [Ornithinimicrobium sp. EGI L100131]|nr:hypothetical protein [Ornithinimicrobium sediminis]MCE0487277.1 hypothetical protein [Ornithinimicrobium sediminis]